MNPFNFFRSFNKKYSSFLLILITLLGFESCKKHDVPVVPGDDNGGGGGGIQPLYGVRMPPYSIRGRIITPQDDSLKGGVNGLKVTLSLAGLNIIIDSTYSHSGFYGFYYEQWLDPYFKYQLRFEDVDGPANGSYKFKDVVFKIPAFVPDTYRYYVNVTLENQ